MGSKVEKYAEALFGGLPDGVLVHSRGRIVYANPCMLEILGCRSSQDLVGRCILELYPEEEYPTAVARLQAIAFGGALRQVDRHRLQRTDGQQADVEITALRLPTAMGPLVIEVVRPARRPTRDAGTAAGDGGRDPAPAVGNTVVAIRED